MRIARAITWLVLKLLAGVLALFVLLRVISPALMTQHNDLAFWAGAACWPLGLVVLVWAGVWLVSDVKVVGRLLNDRKRLPRVL